ncbi:unnamed protein product [Clonostachys solani]|uniref:protein-ribulosamine 3-kinase n=1 Tax=Clonostachys solani TaxID=160281 RepID=A0A9P0EHU4_9HYPO|nr:unnamed protein product [Clonostachys solani]
MATELKEYEADIDVPIESIQNIDKNVLHKLPFNTKILSAKPHSTSLWTRTACLNVETDGQSRRYFLKTTFGERGRLMVSGEFSSMSRIYSASPDLVPRPIAWGTYCSTPDVHFFLCEFREMKEELPGLDSFPARMADLHRNATSENGKFGNDVKTFHGNTPIEHGWSDTWEEYFTRTTRVLLEMEQKVQGPNQEILDLSGPFFGKVIPRLLRPLETGGRSIRPALIHGDLWHGNAAVDASSGEPIIYDAASFYAHNEYELAVWRQPWNNIGAPYRLEYCKHFPPSPPEENFDHRGELYATRVNILDSILYNKDDHYRQMLLESLRSLVKRFSD